MTQAQSRLAPRWKAIFDELSAELVSLPYGSDFFTIGQLCQRFEVSQITAIRVLNELAALNLIEKIPGRGSVVRRISLPMFFRTLQPANVRHDLFTFDSASSRRMEGITAQTRSMGIDHGVMSETHLASLFPRQAGEPHFGFLLMGPVSWKTRQYLRKHDIPHVLVDPLNQYKNTPHARIDRWQAGYLATKHLLELGHRRIAWITGPISMLNFRQRLSGYRQALKEAGIGFDWSLVREVESVLLLDDPRWEIPAKLVRPHVAGLLSLRRPPTAILAGDDHRAIHVLQSCKDMGIEIPARLSVMGYPNNPESSLTQPALSVVDACFEEVGKAAVRLLVETVLAKANAKTNMNVDRKPPGVVIVPPQLVLRQSTGPAAQPKATQPHRSSPG